MILHNVNLKPRGVDLYRYTLRDLDEWEIGELEKLSIDEAWYWYGFGSYDGDGEMIMRKGNSYALHDMGHCSCYGPTDHADYHEFKSLAEIRINVSEEELNRITDLLVAIEHD